ncbi:hypothetical protein [Sphingorhabdus sp.]|uniref:hypothetical protein n=1 Tax=Sphingorhabdus sp. TaxID=1902408 RepID=UPI003BAFFAA9|nr:hypothetical protein [Sphingomonadales bacterium]
MKSTDNSKTVMARHGGLVAITALAIVGGVILAAIANSVDLGTESKKMRTVQSVAQPQKSQRVQPSVRSMSALSEGERLVLAYTAIFGKPKAEDVKSGDYSYSGGQVLQVGKLWVLLAPADHLEAYPINMGALGIFYLSENKGKYALKQRWPEFVGGSIMGNPPEWEVRNDLTDYPVIVSTAGGVWQGYMCQNISLTELRPDAPHVIADFASLYTDGGAKAEGEPTTEIEGKIGAAVKNKSFDVRFEGTSSFTHRYTRSEDGKFIPEPHAEAVPTC